MGSNNDVIIKYSSLVILVLQNTSVVIFMRFAMTGNRPKFLKSVSVCLLEILKLIASTILVMCQEKSIKRGASSIYDQVVNQWREALKVLVPAAVYTAQNLLLYVAIDNLPSTTYMVTYQLKILTTAVFAVIVLHKKITIQQWIALVFLFLGVVVVQYDQKLSNDKVKALKLAKEMANMTSTQANAHAGHEDNLILGFIAVLTACMLSGFGGIYWEKILKGSNVSLWIRNVQLAFPSIFFSLILCFTLDSDVVFANGINPYEVLKQMAHGIDWAVWVAVALGSLGGLVIAVVIKFADNILKAFATSFSIILNCVVAYFVFDFDPTFLFGIGSVLVMGATFTYNMYPYRQQHSLLPTNEKEAQEMEAQVTPAEKKA